MRGNWKRALILASLGALLASACSKTSQRGDADAADDPSDDVATEATSDGATDAPDDAASEPDAVEDPADEDVEEDASADPEEEELPVDPFLTDDDGDGFSEWDGDCDDTNDEIFPGATTHIEGIDYDCDSRREFLAKILIAVDDAYDICVNGAALGSGTSHRESDYYELIMESGLNSVGVNGWDISGVTAAFGMWIEVAGTEYFTEGDRATEPDATRWRYFPTSGESPQVTWCDQSFDDSGWGPARFAEEVGDGAWLYQPDELARLGVTWLWDGNPPGLSDSWFRIKLYLPNVDPVWDAGSTPSCTPGTLQLVSDTTRRLYNGVDVVWNATQWLAVYDQWIRAWRAGVDDDFTRVLDPDGTPASAAVNINDTAATWWNTWPQAAWTGSTMGVFFEDGRSNRNTDIVYGHLTDASGNPTGTDTRIDSATSRQKYPAATFSGSEFGVVWQDDRNGGFEIYFKRVSESMSPVGSATRVTSTAGMSRVPSIAWSGSEYGIVWEDNRDAGDKEIYFARVGEGGSKIGSDVRLTTFTGQSLHPVITWSGSEYAVVWQDDGWVNSEIGFMRLDPTGALVGSMVQVTNDSNVSANPDIVWTGSSYGIVWRDNRSGNADIWLAILSPDGTKTAGDDPVSDTPDRSIHPAVSWSGSAFGVIWMEEEDQSVTTSNPWYMDAAFVAVTCP
ncbi:MAG: hypothetical protein JRG91_15875 [Deltaproteobacteria bacterium]|nr:hypothetical protein [Deltaproteobacteria bacterium]